MNRPFAACLLLVLASILAACAGDDTDPAEVSLPVSDPEQARVDRDSPMEQPWTRFDWLVEQSPAIVVATVTSAEGEMDRERDLIVTRYSIEVERSLKGRPAEALEFVLLGGTADDLTMRVSHVPVLEPGRRYILFVDPERETYDAVIGDERGVYLLDAEDRVFGYSGLALVGLDEQGRPVHAGPRMEALAEGSSEAARPVAVAPEFSGSIRSMSTAEPDAAEPLDIDGFAKLVSGGAVR